MLIPFAIIIILCFSSFYCYSIGIDLFKQMILYIFGFSVSIFATSPSIDRQVLKRSLLLVYLLMFVGILLNIFTNDSITSLFVNRSVYHGIGKVLEVSSLFSEQSSFSSVSLYLFLISWFGKISSKVSTSSSVLYFCRWRRSRSI